MHYFNATELRSLVLATGLLLLGAAARLGFGPGPDDFSWSEPGGEVARPAASLSTIRRQVSDGVTEEEAASVPLAPGERIDPNLAPAAQLRRLPGVGPTRADAIVRERVSGEPFRSPDDLLRVPGIGEKTLRRLEPHLTFGPVLRGGFPTPGTLRPNPSPAAVDVNRAQIKELEQITGIGPALAARIVAVRQRFGPFERAEDLLRVPGIGPAVLQRIGGQVRF